MKIIMTLRELSNTCDWEKVCDVLGLGYYCLNDGADPDATIELTKEQAMKIGVINKE